jgi:4-hydroxybenzoyl-CoA reductase subunit beta
MLRLPAFRVARPRTVDEVCALLAEHGARARVVAGGTDLLPNLKHELYDIDVLVALSDVDELRGVRAGESGGLSIGAATTLAEVAASELVRERAPVLAQACGLVAGPQHRTMGTLGGNVMLDTRCQWINQSYFWRQALGFCLKKDGTLCHVVQGGQKCVAAASNDSAPALTSLNATLAFQSSAGRRALPIEELWRADGIWNKVTGPEDLLVSIEVPAQVAGHRGAYGKLRDRGSIDFPLLGVAVRLDCDDREAVVDADVVLVALQARPVRVKHVSDALRGAVLGTDAFAEAVEEAARLAHKQCHPLPNIPGDPDYRRAMIPVYVRRTLRAAAERGGPVHHL